MGERPDELNRDYQRDMRDLGQSGGSGEHTRDAIPEGSAETEDISAGIEQTRAEMSGTIDAIQGRLSPQHLKEQVKEQVREQFQEAKETVRDATIGKAEEMARNAGETINEARYNIMETIRQNPVPAAMVGIGLGWLFMNSRNATPQYSRQYAGRGRYYRQTYYPDDYSGRSTYESYVSRGNYSGGMLEQGQRAVGRTLNRAQETAGNVVSQAQERVGDVVGQAQETAGYIADQAQYQAQRVEDRFQQALYENPLAVGAAALALGTAIGFTLPQTRRENELLGEARDNLVERAQEVAQDTLEKARQVAGDVIDQAQTTAQEKAREQGLMAE